MRPWADYMVRHGYSVRLPLLPGHGTSVQDMARSTWRQWRDAELGAFQELQQGCDRIFICGLSMGGTLALRLAEELGEQVAGIVLVNAAVHTEDRRAGFARLLQFVLPTLPAIGNDIKRPGGDEHAYDRMPVRAFVQLQQLWAVVRADIQRVQQPTLMMVSAEDHVVEPSNAQWLAANIPALDKASIVLENSFHVATLDNDDQVIFQRSLEFIRRLESSSR